MLIELFNNGTNILSLYRNDEDPQDHNVILYGENTAYGIQLPIFVCSDRYLSYIFGLDSYTNRKAVRLSREDTELVVTTLLDEPLDDFKPNAVIFSDFRREFLGYTTRLTFGVGYHLWRKGDDEQYFDEVIDRSEYEYTLSPYDFIKALILITVRDEELIEALLNQLDM